MKLVIATNNTDKIREIREVLAGLPVDILTLHDFEDFPDPEETGHTLEENARLKAQAVAAFTGFPALADDSGLEVDALNGAPGVYSSRYAGPGCTYADNNRRLLRELEGIPLDKRIARFRCVICIDWADGSADTVEGAAEGYIAEDTVGRQGFGYDPIFIYPPAGKRFAEMTLDEKNRVSHRGRAVQRAREIIEARLRHHRSGSL